MKNLQLTERQSALLERVLNELLAQADYKPPSQPDDLLRNKSERRMLERIWWNAAKLEGKAS